MTVTNVLAGGNPGGCMRGVFGSQAEPFPSQDSFIATGRLSSASFIGDYEEVDAWLLGFDFMATNIVPSGFTVLIYSGFNVISRTLTDTITTTGVWFSIKLPLLDAVSGSWGGDTHLFNNILTNVTRVEFRITRNLEGVQFYFMDNIFLDRLPDAVEVSPTNTVWLHMRSGAQYQFQASADLTQPVWTNLASFTATSSIYQVTFPATNDWRFYRMLMQ